jgi:hypothetical protein
MAQINSTDDNDILNGTPDGDVIFGFPGGGFRNDSDDDLLSAAPATTCRAAIAAPTAVTSSRPRVDRAH